MKTYQMEICRNMASLAIKRFVQMSVYLENLTEYSSKILWPLSNHCGYQPQWEAVPSAVLCHGHRGWLWCGKWCRLDGWNATYCTRAHFKDIQVFQVFCSLSRSTRGFTIMPNRLKQGTSRRILWWKHIWPCLCVAYLA